MPYYKFRLVFPEENGRKAYAQYKNLIKWFEDRNVDYRFDYETSGHYYPKYVWLGEEHALIFKLSFNNVTVDID